MSAHLLTFPSPDLMTDIRKQTHALVDAWLDQLASRVDWDSPPNLRALSALFTATRGDLLGGSLKAFSEALYAQYRHQRQMDCPHCGKRLSRKRVDPKRLDTLQGPLVLERPYFYCGRCKTGFHPLDQALELARGVHQYDIQEKLLRHSAELPYALAAELVGDLVGLSLSNHVAHDTAVAISAIADQETVIPDAADIQRRIDAAKTHPDDKPVLVVALDGAHAPTRPQAKRNARRGPGQWKEAKGVRLYLALADNRIEHLASWHQIQDAETMRRDLAAMAQRIPQDQVRIALLGDGAAWVWNTLTAVFPAGRPILDVYHCKEHLYAVAERLDEAADRATHWVEACLALLSEGRAEAVIAGLMSRRATDPAAREAIDALITYLENQKGRFGYASAKTEGMPIGSGGIESANKCIAHVRLKRSGAWWVIENGNGMLRLRCALYNGTFDQVLEKYIKADLADRGGTIG
jgi:hypothetical protein